MLIEDLARAGVAFSPPELNEAWANPYFDRDQRIAQNSVALAGVFVLAGVGAGAGSLVGGYVGGSLAGPVGFAIEIGVNYLWDYAIKSGVSWIFVNVIGTNDPYLEIRSLESLGSGN